MKNAKVTSARPFRKYLIIVLATLFGSGLALGGLAWYSVFGPNTKTPPEGIFLYIPTGASFSTVMDSLDKHQVLKNRSSFTRLAKKKSYSNKVKAGRYLITNGMSNNKLINLLRSGKQNPVMVTFNSIRTLKQLAGRLSRELEADSLKLYEYMSERENAEKYGFTVNNVLLMFIPNTYEFFWNTSADKLFERMNQEYLRFWNDGRKKTAGLLGLSPIEVGILASIVEMETIKADERPVVAGVYINRLKRGIPLEADPTVIFAIGDFSIKRVLNKHLAYPSPYNTYLNKGLPPGPIAMPSVSSLESVLEYKKHNYIFFCAKPDLSGYHSFATNLNDHMANARAYQRALDKMNIKK